MLDTNICVDLIRGRSERILARMMEHPPAEVCLSSVTLSELEYGAAKSSNPARNRLALAKFIAPLSVLPYDDAVAPTYGRIRAGLERKGTPIGPLDTMIAAHALYLRLILVTDNEREFRRVPGLGLRNWAKDLA